MKGKLHQKQKNRISTEMYLKTIYILSETSKPKPVDIVRQLGLSKGSVSEMVKKMSEEGYINYASFGNITLTDKGVEKAKNVIRKYETVKKFLKDILKIDPDKVHEEACDLEHAFSDESIAKLNILIKLVERK